MQDVKFIIDRRSRNFAYFFVLSVISKQKLNIKFVLIILHYYILLHYCFYIFNSFNMNRYFNFKIK